MLLKILCLSFLIYVNAEKVRYDNYSLFKVNPQAKEDLKFLNELENENGVDFWKTPSVVGDYASVVVTPEKKEEFVHSLKKRNIFYQLMLDNIQQAFDDQIISRKRRDTRNQLYWTNYQTLDDIYAWFRHLSATHSNVVSIINAGQSFEGRNITGIKISRGTSSRAFVIEGGQVGADWLSPTVVTYIVDQLVRGEDPEARIASEEFEWHIFPILNPDGHEFTQNSQRLWVKNRRPTSGNTVGVDLTRNWNSQWGIIGGSFTPSANNYIGLGPFSEPETRAVSRYIEDIGSKLVGLLSFRGFGQRFILPLDNPDHPLYNYNDMMTIGRRAMGSLSVRYNTRYSVGTSRAVHDGSTGAIGDWAKHRFNPQVVATYLLRDEGAWGYTLPVNQVLPTCEETYDSFLAVLREAKFISVL